MSLEWNQDKFNLALGKYADQSKKTSAQVVNTKAYYVARKALWFTKKADVSKIRAELGREVTARFSTNASGGTVARSTFALSARSLAFNIARKRAWDRGDYYMTTSELQAAAMKLISVRERSSAFLKSGWLPSIRFLASYATDKGGAAPEDSTAKQVGQAKGQATAAIEGDSEMRATIINHAIAKRDVRDALGRFGGTALQQAFDDEAKSMMEYLDLKLAAATSKANADLA